MLTSTTTPARQRLTRREPAPAISASVIAAAMALRQSVVKSGTVPLLAAIFSMVGIIGGYFVGVGLLGVDEGAFWSQMQAKIDFEEDIVNGVIKSLVFGLIVTWIAVFEGYDAIPTAEGVSRATTRSVVYSAFAVLGSDFVLTALMLGGD